MKQRSVTHASFTLEHRFRQPRSGVFTAFSAEADKQASFHGPECWAPDLNEK